MELIKEFVLITTITIVVSFTIGFLYQAAKIAFVMGTLLI